MSYYSLSLQVSVTKMWPPSFKPTLAPLPCGAGAGPLHTTHFYPWLPIRLLVRESIRGRQRGLRERRDKLLLGSFLSLYYCLGLLELPQQILFNQIMAIYFINGNRFQIEIFLSPTEQNSQCFLLQMLPTEQDPHLRGPSVISSILAPNFYVLIISSIFHLFSQSWEQLLPTATASMCFIFYF